MLRLLFASIGYVSTATVIAIALVLGYLWNSERLNDEKMFHIVALLHDIDLIQLADEQNNLNEEIPPEEMSLADVQSSQEILDRNFEVKLLALEIARGQFDDRLQQLKERTNRYNQLAEEWQGRLKQQEEETRESSITGVVSHLEGLKPVTAKDLLKRWIEEERMNDVLRLMDKMSASKLRKILNTFQTDEELDQLHHIHILMLDNRITGSALQELEAFDAEN